MKHTLILGLTALFTCTAFAAFNAPLPEFKNEKELAQWRAENASKPLSNSATEEPAFFTGRPYLESSSSYAFKYRNYNPEIARWTSEDPSGFPDGANGSAYAPNPNSELDYQGLIVTTITDGSWVFSENYKLSYDRDTAPSLVGSPWLTGITNLSGFPAGYSLSISGGVLTGISRSVANGITTWTGNMEATVTLNAVIGGKFGPFTVGPTFTDSISTISHWSVSIE